MQLVKNLVILLFVVLTSFNKESYELTISITNIEEAHIGKKIYVGYWVKSNTDFPDVNNVDFKEVEIIKTIDCKIIKKLEANTYAIAVYVDLNGNEKLDKNMFGVPKEPYCFSKNYKPKFSQPDFDDCSFQLNKDQIVELNLLD